MPNKETTMSKLSDTQTNILIAASKRPDGNIEPLPSNVKPGIRGRVIKGLETRELITCHNNVYRINDAGFAAVGLTPSTKPVSRRENTKQARMIALMQRPEGASVEEICTETGWQKHTVRGTFSNTLKKRLGLTITSYKDEDLPRRYRISNESPNESD